MISARMNTIRLIKVMVLGIMGVEYGFVPGPASGSSGIGCGGSISPQAEEEPA